MQKKSILISLTAAAVGMSAYGATESNSAVTMSLNNKPLPSKPTTDDDKLNAETEQALGIKQVKKDPKSEDSDKSSDDKVENNQDNDALDAENTEATSDESSSVTYTIDSIFGEESKIFTRVTEPVKNFFADVMYSRTKIRHNNKGYNLVPTRPDPFMDNSTINGFFQIPIDDKIDIDIKVGRDSYTAASAVVFVPFGTTVRQIVTGPSIFDQRNDAAITVNYYGENVTSNVQFGGSREYDYKSNFIGGETNVGINNNNTTFTGGASYTANILEPDQLGAFVPRIGGRNFAWQILGGVTQLVDAKSLIKTTVTYFYDKGYLNDPYKPMNLPNNRTGWSFATKFLRYLPSFHQGSLEINYRYYTDTWGINSNTIEPIFRFALPYGIGIKTGARYYSQNGSEYYNLFLPRNRSGFFVNDYRYASYGQFGGLLQIDKQLNASNTIYIGGNYDRRKASYRIGGIKVTQPLEPEFTKIRMSTVYIGVKGVY